MGANLYRKQNLGTRLRGGGSAHSVTTMPVLDTSGVSCVAANTNRRNHEYVGMFLQIFIKT